MKVIRNALPLAMAENLRQEMLSRMFNGIHIQGEQGFYTRKQISGYGLPEGDELYSASFREEPWQFCEPYFRHLLPTIEEEVGAVTNAVVKAYRMSTLDHFRVHTDDYLGRGFMLYLSKGWKWDWGGLLMVSEDGGMTANLPEFNTLAFIPKDAPHFVTEISRFAKEPRFAMVGFTS